MTFIFMALLKPMVCSILFSIKLCAYNSKKVKLNAMQKLLISFAMQRSRSELEVCVEKCISRTGQLK